MRGEMWIPLILGGTPAVVGEGARGGAEIRMGLGCWIRRAGGGWGPRTAATAATH